ncbi:MAG: transglycosylase domain-containing protein [Pseudomonadota bacterium]
MFRTLLFATLIILISEAGRVADRATLHAPPPTLLLEDRHGTFLAELSQDPEQELGYWAVGEIPWRVAAATVAIEDKRFWDHPGVDPKGVARALVQNVRSGEVVSGASTLAMQVARMQDPGPRTLGKKVEEALTALVLTQRYGRQAIMAHYLRLVPYGNRIHGIEYAARHYLDKPVVDLSWAEVAFLAALPQAPSRTNPFRASGRQRAVARAGRILGELHAGGVIDDDDFAQGMLDLEALRVPDHGLRPAAAMHPILGLEAQLRADPARWERLTQEPVVRCSLDLALQERIQGFVADHVASLEPAGAGNGAVVVLDRQRRDVLAAVGSTGWDDPRFAGAIDYTRVPRYPGSTLKPFLYALALDRGLLRPDTLLDDLQRGPDGIGNADERFLGPLLPRRALANSRNVPAVRLLETLGLDEGYALLGQLGLNDGAHPASHYGLGLALGNAPVTLLALTTAYAALADDGVLQDVVWLPERDTPARSRVLSPAASRTVALWLSDPLARLPSFPRMGFSEYPFPVAVKTGTSEDWRDAWAVAFSDRYVVGAWVGHPDWRPMREVSGFGGGASLVQQVMDTLHAGELDGLSDLSFPPPEGWVPVHLCPLSGQAAGPDCDHTVTEYFAPGTEPLTPCAVHKTLAVDRRDGSIATISTPAGEVVLRHFVDLPPEYATWAERQGLPRPPPEAALADPLALSDPARPVLRITAPQEGLRIVPDPETPPELSTLALTVVVDPPVEQVLWRVDGQPFALVDAPYGVRWPMIPGEHVFQAEVPALGAVSQEVRVVLR